jgi:hypothetical protein
MANSDRPKIRFDVSFARGVWVATIYNGDNTENRSFRNEIDALDYAKARVNEKPSRISAGGSGVYGCCRLEWPSKLMLILPSVGNERFTIRLVIYAVENATVNTATQKTAEISAANKKPNALSLMEILLGQPPLP